MESAARASKANYQRICKLTGAGEQDIAVLNVVALSSLGTLKTQVLEQFRKEYTHFPGVTLVLYPLVPTHTYWKKREVAAALGAEAESPFASPDSDEDVDNLSHDFCTDTLPEAITKAVAKMSSKQRVVQLTKDHDAVRRTLVTDSSLATHYG